MKPLLALALAALSPAALAFEGDVARVGSAAPGFQATATDGTPVSLEALRGRVVVLDFFATWCGPCMAEMPLVERDIWRAHKADGLVVIAVGREHQAKELAEFKASKGFSFAVVPDPARAIYGQYATKFIPRCYVIGRDGTIRYASVGYDEKDFGELKAAIDAELRR